MNFKTWFSTHATAFSLIGAGIIELVQHNTNGWVLIGTGFSSFFIKTVIPPAKP